MKILSILFILVVSMTNQALAQPASGSAFFGGLRARQIGPAAMSGRITSIDAVHNNPEIIYVGTAGGGVWKSISGGANFRPIFDDHIQSIGKVAIYQENPQVVWVGTGEPWVRNSVGVGNGVYKTSDGGTTWTHLGLGNTQQIADIVLHPSNPDVAYVAAQGHLWNANEDRGVYKTTDGGKTWKKVLYIDDNTGAADLDIDPQNPDVLYAAMWSHRRYPWAFDSGLNGKSGLYKSTDGGQTWNPIHNGLPKEALGRMAIAVAPSNRDVIYLSVECKSKEGKGLYLSTDQGASWKRVSTDQGMTIRPFYFSHMVVDPKNDSIMMKAGLSLSITENRGIRFRSMDQSVHSDIHAIWIDPNNTKHVLIGSDGGVYESFDRGQTFKMFMNLPVSQFYHVSVDNEMPFNVYGGLQDNGSWYAPSRKAGGITNSDWKSTFGGDGFWSFPHPTDKDIVFSEYQGGNLVRYSKSSGIAKEIRPFPASDEPKYRFNWNAPIHISPNNPDRMYFGSQFLFKSDDKGDTWTRISPDLTTNNPDKQKQKQSGGLTIDNSSAENHCTIYVIAEAPGNPNTIWAGTDDGNLQLTTDGGKTWANVATNLSGLPANTWVSNIEPSRHDSKTAFATFDGHRTGDMTPYLYKTTDLGKTWVKLPTTQVEGHLFCIRQDLVNPDLLFLGSELGLYISLDGGQSWARFTNNMPKVAVHDMVIHPRDNALAMATHGRGVILLDDITSLRQLTKSVMAKPFHFFELAPTVLRDPGAGGGWFGGSGNFVGPNPPAAAQIAYYMSKRHTFGKMNIEVWKDGKLLKTLAAGKSAGINVVEMPTALEKPKSAPTKNRAALVGSLFGPNLEAGKYDVKVIKGNDVYEGSFTLVYDPQTPYSVADRATQRELTMKLYNMTERLAYLHEVLTQVEKQAVELAPAQKGKLKTTIEAFAKKAVALKGSFIATEGDMYVDEEEKLLEEISDTYRQVSSYPGRPTNSQIQRSALLEKQMAEVDNQFKALLEKELAEINQKLTAAKSTKTLTYPTFEAFMSEEKEGGAAGSNGLKGLRNLLANTLIWSR